MPHGRLDDESTVNLGLTDGGSAINVVPEHCTLAAEVRSLSEERAEEILEDVVQAINEAANLPECDCDVDITIERTFAAYQTQSTTTAVRVAEQALRASGYEPVRIASGGASDANALIADGFQVVNLANGTERNHQPDERVSTSALEGMLDVAFALLPAAAAQTPPASR
jgi:tripeptide aminopeptidase